MNKFKKLAVKALSLAVAAVTALSVGVNASAAVINFKWSYDASAPKQEDRIGRGGKNTRFSVDDKVHTDSSWFSIKLENTNHNISYVERTYNVQPNTAYKFSAMVKYSGYQLDPSAEAAISGACVGKAFSYNNSGYTISNGWTLMEYEFTTGNETTVNLALQNGIYNGKCKGTAWFSDVKLEKAELTNNWDILTVFFKNIDATVSPDDKIVQHKSSITDSQINEINTYVLDMLPSELKNISNNKITVNSIDRFYVDETLTEKDLKIAKYSDDAKTIPHGYNIDTKNSESIPKVLDKYLNQKNYNQILVFSPLYGIDGGTLGWGGTKYNGVNIASIFNRKDGGFKNSSNYPCATIVHEICHGLEHESQAINNNKTADFHDMYNYPDLDGREWHIRYINDTLPDGKKGVEPAAFYRPSGKYTLVDSDMTTGTGITPGSSLVLPPAPKNLTVESIEDSKVKVSWDPVTGVSGYQLVLFKDSAYKEVWLTYDQKPEAASTRLSPITKGKPYYYGIRAAYSQNGTTVYSDWTYLTYTHMGAGILYGDINNDGKFNIADLTALIGMYANGQTLDQRTLAAAGVSGRDKIQLSDIVNLAVYYANNL